MEKSLIFLQSSTKSIDRKPLDLGFLHITYHSKRVGGKVSIKLNANVKKASIMMLLVKDTIFYTVMHLI